MEATQTQHSAMPQLVYMTNGLPVKIGDKRVSGTWSVQVVSIDAENGVIRMRHLQGAAHEYDEKYPGNIGAEWMHDTIDSAESK